MNRNWECGISIDDPNEIDELANLLLRGFGAAHLPQHWHANEIEMLREPVRVLREQMPAIKLLPALDAAPHAAITLRRASQRKLLKSFTRNGDWIMGTHIVVTGNPVDGFTFYGVFKTAEDANDWAELRLNGKEWWVAALVHPTTSKPNRTLPPPPSDS
jgi:hypothetical protein